MFWLSPTILKAEIGKVTEQTGPTEIRRKQNVIPSSLQSAVEMSDVFTTANAKAGITFKDDTKVEITEHSRLVIDNFVYDGNKKTGKLSMKMALGTVKYASGQIAKNNPQQVVVETPTATIGVRGTDFSGTVDETGKSTVILLPSCPKGWRNIERDCVTGQITVTTDSGTVLLTRPFESTTVMSRITAPKAVLLNLDLNQINNMLIVTPPKEVATTTRTTRRGFNFLDEDLLGRDLLKNEELDKDLLKYNRLGENKLDFDFLYNFLDVSGSQMLTNELDQFGVLLPKYNAASGLKFQVESEEVILWRETVNAYIDVKFQTTNSLTLNITQEGLSVKQLVNGPGSTTITIKQSQ